MPFNHKDYNARFLATPGQNDAWPKYGVEVIPAIVQPGQVYWRVIGVHHLLPEENMSNRNVYMDVLGEQGNRIKNPIVWAGWTWEGIQGHERADPTPLDKPDNETAGNISVGGNQKVSVWIKGRSRASNDKSDKVVGLHTGHPDEVLPDGRKLNTWGHHSFYVAWQRTVKRGTAPPPIVTPPPGPGPISLPDAPDYIIGSRLTYTVSHGGELYAEAPSLDKARRIAAALTALDASDADHPINRYREELERWSRGEA